MPLFLIRVCTLSLFAGQKNVSAQHAWGRKEKRGVCHNAPQSIVSTFVRKLCTQVCLHGSVWVSRHGDGSSPPYLRFVALLGQPGVCVISPTALPSPPAPPPISFPHHSLSFVCLFSSFVCFGSFHLRALSNFTDYILLYNILISLSSSCTGGRRDRLIALVVRALSCLPSRARLKFTDRERFLLRPGVDS